VTIPLWLVALAERKLGAGAVVRVVGGEWIAECGRVRLTTRSRDTLVWFLEQMADV